MKEQIAKMKACNEQHKDGGVHIVLAASDAPQWGVYEGYSLVSLEFTVEEAIEAAEGLLAPKPQPPEKEKEELRRLREAKRRTDYEVYGQYK